MQNIRKLTWMISEKNVTIFQHEKIVEVVANMKWKWDWLKTALHNTFPNTRGLCQISGSLPAWFLRKCDWIFQHEIKVKCLGKQEVEMRLTWYCLTWYNSLYWSSVPNIRKLTCMVAEKNVTEIYIHARWCRTRKDDK